MLWRQDERSQALIMFCFDMILVKYFVALKNICQAENNVKEALESHNGINVFSESNFVRMLFMPVSITNRVLMQFPRWRNWFRDGCVQTPCARLLTNFILVMLPPLIEFLETFVNYKPFSKISEITQAVLQSLVLCRLITKPSLF